MKGFVLSPRWLVAHLAVLAAAGVCVSLGLWQLERLESRRAYNATILERTAMPERSLAALTSEDPEAVAFHPVHTRGVYDAERQVLLVGRSHQGRPGHHVLTPLATDDGTAVLVDRGWVPLDREPTDPANLPPTGRVTVSGYLLAPERGPALGGQLPSHVRAVDTAALGERLPYDLHPVYVLLQHQEPSPGADAPIPASIPELDDGPHFAYAVQWFTFAVLLLVTYAVLLHREARKRAGAQSPQGAPSQQGSM